MTTPVRAAQPPLSLLRVGMTARTASSAPPLLRLPAALLPAALLLAACGGPAPKDPGGAGADGGEDDVPDVDLVSKLPEGEARAGVVSDERALFGGTAASGRVGDLKLYNHVARFVITGLRPGDYFIRHGGVLIDADAERPEGEAGRDLLDEHSPMLGLGRIVQATAVEVLDPGGPGRAAVVQVRGVGAPFELLTGATESPDFVPDIDVEVVTTYTLAPDSPLLQIETTLTWNGSTQPVQVGDLALYGIEAGQIFGPGVGFAEGTGRDPGWVAVVAHDADVALGIFGEGEADFPGSPVEALLSDIGPVLATLRPSLSLSAGQQHRWSRSIGVGRDLATLTGAWYASRGVSTTTVGGLVEVAGAPVEGVRVVLQDEAGRPATVALTGPDGRWSADLPATAGWTALGDGRGDGRSVDLPAGAPWYPPHGAAFTQQLALDTLLAPRATAWAEGLGLAGPAPVGAETPLDFVAPGRLVVELGDGRPAVVRVDFAAGDPVVADSAKVRPRADGRAGWLYLRDGAGALALEPGDYVVTVHRGLRWEAETVAVSVESGADTPLALSLTQAFETPGLIAIDPHSHASPSPDARIEMAERLVTSAAHGVDLHIGTDHEHVADYRPLLSALGLDRFGASVPATEVSPVLKGHTNVWPLVLDPAAQGGGGLRWWELDIDTDALYAAIHEAYGPGAMLQVNHPSGGAGMFGAADLLPDGSGVSAPSRWSSNFELVEVLNDGSWADYTADFLGLVNHGVRAVPVGVSDSHGHENGMGANVTWLYTGEDHAALTDLAALKAATLAGGTVPALGPYLDLRVGGAWASGQRFTGPQALDVQVRAAGWCRIDRVQLLRDGVVVDERAVLPEDAGAGGLAWSGRFELDPEDDASYVVMAHGSADMSPVYPGKRPWAMSAPLLIDREGDGWTPPGGAFTVGG